MSAPPQIDLDLPLSSSSKQQQPPILPLTEDPNLHHEEYSSPPQVNGSANPATNTTPLKDTLLQTASSTMATVGDATQNVKDTIVNGPVGQTVQDQTAKTSNEFKDLADSRVTPEHPAATGQPLTHYHSLFYRLLSWKNPRATAITFAATVIFIFAARYLNVLRYTFKALYTILGITALAEGAGKAALGSGFATQIRPRKYWTIRKESLERFTEDLEQLINFVVIEFQRIVFAENIWVTVAAFATSFISYFLIKWLPLWGLSLIFTTTAFLAPLVYVKNKEAIDAQINHAGNVISAQTNQVRDIAAQHTSQATKAIQSYAGEYTQKAQEYIGQARGRANGSSTPVAPLGKKEDKFPAAPKNDPFPSVPQGVVPPLEQQLKE